MKNVIWFSRHPITTDEMAGIKEVINDQLKDSEVEVINMTEDAKKTLTTEDEVNEVYAKIIKTIKENDAAAVFGVFAAPIQMMLSAPSESLDIIPAFAAWNVMRAPLPEDSMPRSMVVSSTPMFKFKQWCFVGFFHLND